MRKGDLGLTDLLNETSVKKSDPRVRALAQLDVLTAALGYAKLKSKERDLETLQKYLSSVCAETAGGKKLSRVAVVFIEDITAKLEKKQKMPKTFVLPGKTEAETALHAARAQCRLAETHLAALPSQNADVLRFVNRLSRYLFLLALKHT